MDTQTNKYSYDINTITNIERSCFRFKFFTRFAHGCYPCLCNHSLPFVPKHQIVLCGRHMSSFEALYWKSHCRGGTFTRYHDARVGTHLGLKSTIAVSVDNDLCGSVIIAHQLASNIIHLSKPVHISTHNKMCRFTQCCIAPHGSRPKRRDHLVNEQVWAWIAMTCVCTTSAWSAHHYLILILDLRSWSTRSRKKSSDVGKVLMIMHVASMLSKFSIPDAYGGGKKKKKRTPSIWRKIVFTSYLRQQLCS
eukprot:SAG11_NODE_8946_length_960_cov_1.167247_1_plen_250_part_00